MIKMLTACTTEIDEPQAAAQEILKQLEQAGGLRKSSVGLLTCHADFITSGAIIKVCESLPFDVVGTTTLGAATNRDTGLEILTLSVLTSDEVTFAAVLTDSLQEKQEEPIMAACESARSTLPGQPSMVLAYAPLLPHVGGERLLRLLDKALKGVPVFGTLACDHNFDFHDSQVVFNGKAHRDRLALVLMSGPVKYSFLTISVPEGKAEKESAIITESEGNVVKKVNDLPVLSYLETIGLTRESGLEGSKSIPVILNYNDGTPAVARCFYMISPEGYAVCGGEMPMGATFGLSSMEPEDILISAGQVLNKVQENKNITAMLIFPCIVRSVTLGVDQLAEARLVSEKLGTSLPYQLCYSGGEICPVYQKDGNTANRFHNFSFAACLFEE
ncbi:FIST C-terminal domain-containing protein [Desulfovibrio sp. OttesenSCG-928-C06]|nr:FIST C-terminal domain-containing protein [Desulfovibrio sp. OttesenSCG-928-C06]